MCEKKRERERRERKERMTRVTIALCVYDQCVDEIDLCVRPFIFRTFAIPTFNERTLRRCLEIATLADGADCVILETHSLLSRGQTCLVLSQRDMQWKWNACCDSPA